MISLESFLKVSLYGLLFITCFCILGQVVSNSYSEPSTSISEVLSEDSSKVSKNSENRMAGSFEEFEVINARDSSGLRVILKRTSDGMIGKEIFVTKNCPCLNLQKMKGSRMNLRISPSGKGVKIDFDEFKKVHCFCK